MLSIINIIDYPGLNRGSGRQYITDVLVISSQCDKQCIYATISFLTCFNASILATLTAIPMPPPMHFANFLSLSGGKYNVSWMHDTSKDILHFMVEVMATGWIGLGFSTAVPPARGSMIGYDVAVAIVNEAGEGSITVKYSTVLPWRAQ